MAEHRACVGGQQRHSPRDEAHAQRNDDGRHLAIGDGDAVDQPAGSANHNGSQQRHNDVQAIRQIVLGEQTPASAITPPAERSSLPLMRGKVMPIATTDTVDVCFKMFSRLAEDKNAWLEMDSSTLFIFHRFH